MTDFQLLLSSNTRKDDYVNATQLCKHFGKRWAKYQELPSTKEFIGVLNKKTDNRTIYAKRGVGTWVHPLLAVHLAEWLSPEFSVFVKQTFKAFLDADIKLAESIVDRTEDLEGIKRLTTKAQRRQEQLKAYHGLHDELKEHKAEAKHHAIVNKINNQHTGISSRKNGITETQTDMLTILETAEKLKLQKTKTENAWRAVKVCKETGNEIKQFLLKQGIAE